MDRDLDAHDTATAEELRREETIRTYETTPATTTEAGVAGGAYAPTATTTERRMETVEDPEPFSFVAGFLGWAVASFFTFIFLAIVLGIIGTAAYNDSTIVNNALIVSQNTINNLAWPGIVGALVAVFVAYFLGGYNASRIDRYHGVGQGLAVVAWTVLFGIVAAILANNAAAVYNVGAYLAPYQIDWGALTTQAVTGLILTLLVMLAGAILGGVAGERWMRRDVAFEERREYRAGRSRPRV